MVAISAQEINFRKRYKGSLCNFNTWCGFKACFNVHLFFHQHQFYITLIYRMCQIGTDKCLVTSKNCIIIMCGIPFRAPLIQINIISQDKIPWFNYIYEARHFRRKDRRSTFYATFFSKGDNLWCLMIAFKYTRLLLKRGLPLD